VPPNAHATVRIPASKLSQVKESGHALRKAPGVSSARVKGNVVVVEVGSGQYEFVSTGLNLAQDNANVRHVAGRLDIASSLRDLLENERARVIVTRYVGEEALNAPMIGWVMDQPFEALVRFAPQALTSERLQALQQELITL
jgi:hypothetical protein